MKKTLLLLAFLFSSISMLANQKIDPPTESEAKAIVCIYRPSNFVGFGRVFNLKVNGEEIGKIKNGKKVILKLPLGKTIFKVRGKTVELELQAGKTYYLRSVLVRNMFLGKLDLVAVTEEFAKRELKSIK
ncbi:DUF2846 domain-containing protein [Aquimarina sp. 2201CG5-10]|uniref:DUF2846 domain-containing protein n=1 Tax=Aquimarina callyspongiae TaxID=3098150 RepID=UPI002AB581A0|nr:DUF2846 domain-containing protein [Aquimarina sp. 2201CG5-10]MDY8136045.1 DUF2846 domain-containing protein [Aquimarina sp. 2201CG5-10]